MPGYFITGTDTGVGKTWFTCWLTRAWRHLGHKAAAIKPLSTGDREDAAFLRESSGNVLTLDETNPYYFERPAAPLIAAKAEKRTIDFPALNSSIKSMESRFSHFAIEGVGGWRVPLASNYDVRDWARDLGLPVVIVALNRLGMINHTLLTVESIQAAGLTCAGVIVNAGATPSPDLDLTRRDNILVLESLLRLPVLEFERSVQAAGHVPLWLGGKEV